MEDNIEDEDADDELRVDADELEEDVEEDVDVEEQADAGVDDLLSAMGNITVQIFPLLATNNIIGTLVTTINQNVLQ